MEKSQTETFKAHLWRVPNPKGGYHYEIEYIVDPQASPLPDNYVVSYQRHCQLRKSFALLEPETQEEFMARLTKGLESNYWKILDESEALDLRNPPKPGGHRGHYLPAGFVLKSQGSTQARLVLDPSSSLNEALLKAPNFEENIGSVL